MPCPLRGSPRLQLVPAVLSQDTLMTHFSRAKAKGEPCVGRRGPLTCGVVQGWVAAVGPLGTLAVPIQMASACPLTQ